MDDVTWGLLTKSRLAGWERRCLDNHATPLVLVAIGHGQRRGQILVLVPEEPDLDPELIKGFLRKALDDLEAT